MKRKLFKTLAILAVITIFCVTTAFAPYGWQSVQILYEGISVTYEGSRLSLGDEPLLLSDRTFLPVRAVCQALGVGVTWNDASNTVQLHSDAGQSDDSSGGSNTTNAPGWRKVSILYDNYKVTFDGSALTLPEEPFLYNDRTYLPVRAVSQALGLGVTWNGATKTVQLHADPSITDDNVPAPSDDFRIQVLELTNQFRAQNGLSPLKWNQNLADVGQIHTDDMAARNYFSHNTPEGLTPFDRMKNYGIRYRSAAENIAYGQRSPQEVVNAWINSSGHRANMLGNYEYLGVGYTANGHYWAQEFATLQ